MESSPPNPHDADAAGHAPDLLKSLTDKRLTRDGQPAKRRGPKPDSKPALTRRQELNRQAQRTHRERKEFYIKALEDEVLRLREVYSNVSQDKEKLAEENKQLKGLLHSNGIASASLGTTDDAVSNPSLGYTSSGSVSGSYAAGSGAAYTPPLTSLSTAPSVSASSQMVGIQYHQQPSQHQHQQHRRDISQTQPAQSRVDYDQAGIDFVLTLEKPCMEHLPWLVDRSNEGEREPCGHALMATCPPAPFTELTEQIPFGYQHSGPKTAKIAPTWELSKGDLATLLDLSRKLDLDGEITPVMAWGIITNHPRLAELRVDDLQKITDELKSKVRCFGFGAVLEEFEVRDALNSVFLTKPELGTAF